MAREKTRRDRADKEMTEVGGNYSIDNMTKGNIWTYEPEDIHRMLIEVMLTNKYKDNKVHYHNIIRPVFDLHFVNREDEEKVAAFEAENYQIFSTPDYEGNNAIAIRKHQIKKITDLTHENIFHLTPQEVLHLIDENMGTGWQGLPLAIQDIIQAAFTVDCSVMPATAMHRVGGLIDRRKADGYEVLEVARGTWVEGVFLKVRPRQEKLRFEVIVDGKRQAREDDDDFDDEDDDDDDLDDGTNDDNDDEEEDDEPNEADATLEDIEDIESAEDDDE